MLICNINVQNIFGSYFHTKPLTDNLCTSCDDTVVVYEDADAVGDNDDNV